MVCDWTAMQKPAHLTCVMSYESQCSMYRAARRGGFWSQDGSLSNAELGANRMNHPKLLATTEYPDEAFDGVSSKYKWLEMHTGNRLGAFYEPEHLELQRKFLDNFLFEKDDGRLDTFDRENETVFPPPDEEDVTFYLRLDQTLSSTKSADNTQTPFKYHAYGSGDSNLQFQLDTAFPEPFELLGSPHLEVEVSTKAKNLDLFIYLRALNTKNNPIALRGNYDEPMDSFAQGYFRLSHCFQVRAAFPFDKDQSMNLEIGHVNTSSNTPPMRHEGGDRTAERFDGENVLFSQGKLALPRVRR
ncbi:hypothetical protein BJX99DRAFT_243816 [Aspergillus californicus]